MNLLKKERAALIEIAESGDFLDSGEFVDALVKKLDEVRGERVFQHAFLKIAGVWTVAGAYSTANQARKAIEKYPLAERAYVVPGRTAEGWVRHLEEIEKPREPSKEFALVREDAIRFAKRGGW